MSNEPSSQSRSPEVVVVEASAGSGKTYALATRYLRLLINPHLKSEQIPLRSILAITFTNKATVEMKERILEFLKRIAFNDFVNEGQKKDILSILDVDQKLARQKARLIMDELIRHYSFFQVQTIDSFINALLTGCALQIDRSASFEIKSTYDQHLAYCLDLVIDQTSTDSEVLVLFREFLDHYLFVEERTGWFPKESILELMSSLFKMSNKYGRLFLEPQAKGLDVIKMKKALFGEIRELAEDFPEGMNKTAQKSIIRLIDNNDDILDISALPAKFRQADVPMNKGQDCSPEYKKAWAKIHRGIKKLVDLESTVAYKPYVKLFHRLLDVFQSVSKKEDILFLEELNRKARALYGEDGTEGITVAELYYRLATRFRHYLIDEFQDTSELQWRNLHTMVEEALSTGGSLFYVGDKKQAIYRFRGGETRLFDAVKNEFSHFNVIPQTLTRNWRSQKAIVEFNNKVFSQDNLRRALEVSGIAEELSTEPDAVDEVVSVFKDATQQHRSGNESGYVRVERIDEKNQEERNEIMQGKITDLVKELSKRFAYEDITILTRDNSEVELVTFWLLKAGIPVESEKTLNILENSLIKELIAFLKFLRSPIEDLSFAAFVLGEMFSHVSGLKQAEVRDFIFNLPEPGQRGTGLNLYNLFRQAYPKVWDKCLDEFFKNVGFISTYELLVSIYRKFEVMEKFKSNQAFFVKLLELVKKTEGEYVGLGEFLLYLDNARPEDLYVRVAQSDSVRVLTIHKSKGLEFPVVVIPFLRMDILAETGGKGTKSHVEDETKPDLGLVRITKYYRPYSSKLQSIYVRDYKKACIDELNNIYVALTRPRHELYVFVPSKSITSKNKARQIIPEDISELGSQKTYEKKKKKTGQSLMNISPSMYRDWIEILRDEFGGAERVRQRQNLLQGNIIHTMLATIDNCQSVDLEALISRAIRNARINYPFVKNLKGYEQKLRQMLDRKDMKEFFFVSDGEVFCEKELVNSSGDTKRVDRLVIKDKEAWIIDYKSISDGKELHQDQLREYMGVVREVYPGRLVKGYLVYLDKMKIEEVKV